MALVLKNQDLKKIFQILVFGFVLHFKYFIYDFQYFIPGHGVLLHYVGYFHYEIRILHSTNAEKNVVCFRYTTNSLWDF